MSASSNLLRHPLQTDRIYLIVFFIFSLFVFTRGLSIHGLEYRDDEIFYVRSTQEMIQSGNFISPTYFGENRFQKPILYYWFILLSYKIFGINWFAARFASSVFGALTVCLTWLIGKRLFDRSTATLSAFMLMTLPLFFRHAKNAVPDMALTFFIVWAMYSAIQLSLSTHENKSKRLSVLFFVACGLGFMVKGVAALAVPMATAVLYAAIVRKKGFLKDMHFGLGVIILAILIAPWFLYMIQAHGKEYSDYILIQETKNRILGQGGNVVIERIASFAGHLLFYLKTILSYFAPWSIFLFFAVPLAVVRWRRRVDEGQALVWLLAWLFVVLFIFSNMYFVINHYMMALATPFVILVSYFLLSPIRGNPIFASGIIFLRKGLLIMMVTISLLAFSFLVVFLAGYNPAWLILIAGVYCAVLVVMVRHKSALAAPLVLAAILLTVYSQATIMRKGGIGLVVLQKFADTINAQIQKGDLVVVGSHDIHEKEFQIYFDRLVIKIADDDPIRTKHELLKFLSESPSVYCLLTKNDLDFLSSDLPKDSYTIIQEEYSFRRHMRLDQGFFWALFKLDQGVVQDYLKEKTVLIRKE